MTSRDDLRIGDAERDTAMTALREHYAQGRLTHEELDERIERTLAARTGGELALVSADLPDLYGSRHGDQDAPEHGWEDWGPGRPGPWHGGRGHHGRGPRRAGRHPAAWHHHAAWHHRTGRRGGPPIAPFLMLMLVVGVATTGFWSLKFVFAAWLAVAVLGLLRRRRWHHPRTGRPGH
ncbi:DUF1707 SHOCT-like domain-containing protein [Streptosporangium sp. NPDC003464]